MLSDFRETNFRCEYGQNSLKSSRIEHGRRSVNIFVGDAVALRILSQVSEGYHFAAFVEKYLKVWVAGSSELFPEKILRSSRRHFRYDLGLIKYSDILISPIF